MGLHWYELYLIYTLQLRIGTDSKFVSFPFLSQAITMSRRCITMVLMLRLVLTAIM